MSEKSKPFKNISGFYGIRQCVTDCGEYIRVQRNHLYILSDEAYIFSAHINPKKTLRKIWEDYKNSLTNEEEENEEEENE